MELLWCIPNQVTAGHRLDDTVEGHNSLPRLIALARLTEEHGWGGALIGPAGSGRTPSRSPPRWPATTTFNPLIAIRPGYWTEDDITFEGDHYRADAATLEHRPVAREGRPHPQLYFGGASEAAQRTRPPRRTCSSSGASRSTAWRRASTTSGR